MFLFKVVTMMSFNFSVIVSSLGDAGRTLVHTLGPYGVAIACGALLALACTSAGAARALLWGLRTLAARFAPGPRSGVACLGLLCYFAASDLWYAANELVLYPRSYFLDHPYIPGPLSVPDYSGVTIRSKESVFIVQLESVNALTLFERTSDAEGFRPRVAQPGLETILKEGGGVLFPFFWANSVQTNRAWEAILCGVSGNLGPPISQEPARLLRRTCLPELLGDAGYARVFLYSYFELDFFNLRGFASRAGFQEVAHGPKLMAKGDLRHEWAYDDCVFYERAFEYLAREARPARAGFRLLRGRNEPLAVQEHHEAPPGAPVPRAGKPDRALPERSRRAGPLPGCVLEALSQPRTRRRPSLHPARPQRVGARRPPPPRRRVRHVARLRSPRAPRRRVQAARGTLADAEPGAALPHPHRAPARTAAAALLRLRAARRCRSAGL
jgi:hypothetical protein